MPPLTLTRGILTIKTLSTPSWMGGLMLSDLSLKMLESFHLMVPELSLHRELTSGPDISSKRLSLSLIANHSFPSSRHAGYSYSGPAAAWAYKSLDISKAYCTRLFFPLRFPAPPSLERASWPLTQATGAVSESLCLVPRTMFILTTALSPHVHTTVRLLGSSPSTQMY